MEDSMATAATRVHGLIPFLSTALVALGPLACSSSQSGGPGAGDTDAGDAASRMVEGGTSSDATSGGGDATTDGAAAMDGAGGGDATGDAVADTGAFDAASDAPDWTSCTMDAGVPWSNVDSGIAGATGYLSRPVTAYNGGNAGAGISWNQASSTWFDIYFMEAPDWSGASLTVPLRLNPATSTCDVSKEGTCQVSEDRHAILNGAHPEANYLDFNDINKLTRTTRSFGLVCSGALLSNDDLRTRIESQPWDQLDCSNWGDAVTTLQAPCVVPPDGGMCVCYAYTHVYTSPTSIQVLDKTPSDDCYPVELFNATPVASFCGHVGLRWNGTSTWLDVYGAESAFSGASLTVPLTLAPTTPADGGTTGPTHYDRRAILGNQSTPPHPEFASYDFNYLDTVPRTSRSFAVVCGGTVLYNDELAARIQALPANTTNCGDWGTTASPLPAQTSANPDGGAGECFVSQDVLGPDCYGVEILP
jgi:hypothetical protein